MFCSSCRDSNVSAASRIRALFPCKTGQSKMARCLLALRKFTFRPSSFRLSALRPIHTGSMNLGNLEEEFQSASERTKTLKQDPGNDHKLKLYALFKQVTRLRYIFYYRLLIPLRHFKTLNTYI